MLFLLKLLLLFLSRLFPALLRRLVDEIAALGNYEIECIANYLEIDSLSTLDLSVDTDRNRLVKLHFEVGNLLIHKYLVRTLVFKVRTLFVMRNKAKERSSRHLVDSTNVK